MLIGRDEVEFRRGAVVKLFDNMYVYKGISVEKKELYFEGDRIFGFDDVSSLNLSSVEITSQLIRFLESDEQETVITRSNQERYAYQATKLTKGETMYVFVGEIDDNKKRFIYDKSMVVPEEMYLLGFYSKKLKTFYYGQNSKNNYSIMQIYSSLDELMSFNGFSIVKFHEVKNQIEETTEQLLEEKLQSQTVENLMSELQLDEEIEIEETAMCEIRTAVEYNYITYGLKPKDLKYSDLFPDVFTYSENLRLNVSDIEIVKAYTENTNEFSERMLMDNLKFYYRSFFTGLTNFQKAQMIWDNFTNEEIDNLELAKTARAILTDRTRKTVKVKIKGLIREFRLQTKTTNKIGEVDFNEKSLVRNAFSYSVSYHDIENKDNEYLREEYEYYRDNIMEINLMDIESISYKNKILYSNMD